MQVFSEFLNPGSLQIENGWFKNESNALPVPGRLEKLPWQQKKQSPLK
jgi:hypothetical protein